MHNFLLAIFVVSIILILHTYLFYPLGMILIYSKNSKPVAQYSSDSELPELAVLIAAYNEEKVIEEKKPLSHKGQESILQEKFVSHHSQLYLHFLTSLVLLNPHTVTHAVRFKTFYEMTSRF